MALSDRVWHLLESYFCSCYVNIDDFPKPAHPCRFIDLDQLRKASKVRWLEEPESTQEEPGFQRPPFTLQDIELAAANLGFKLANAKDEYRPISDGVLEVYLTASDRVVYQFQWDLK
jgi:hypothetical protein